MILLFHADVDQIYIVSIVVSGSSCVSVCVCVCVCMSAMCACCLSHKEYRDLKELSKSNFNIKTRLILMQNMCQHDLHTHTHTHVLICNCVDVYILLCNHRNVVLY